MDYNEWTEAVWREVEPTVRAEGPSFFERFAQAFTTVMREDLAWSAYGEWAEPSAFAPVALRRAGALANA